MNIPCFHNGKKKYFLCSPYSSLNVTLCNGMSIGEYEAYYHMNFSLINGCGTSENNVCGHSSFEAMLHCELTDIIIVTKKKLTNRYEEKFVILQSIGILVIKSRETRAVIYTCRLPLFLNFLLLRSLLIIKLQIFLVKLQFFLILVYL